MNVKVKANSDGRRTPFSDGREVALASVTTEDGKQGWMVEFVDYEGEKLRFFASHEAMVALFQMFGYIYARDSGFKLHE